MPKVSYFYFLALVSPFSHSIGFSFSLCENLPSLLPSCACFIIITRIKRRLLFTFNDQRPGEAEEFFLWSCFYSLCSFKSKTKIVLVVLYGPFGQLSCPFSFALRVFISLLFFFFFFALHCTLTRGSRCIGISWSRHSGSKRQVMAALFLPHTLQSVFWNTKQNKGQVWSSCFFLATTERHSTLFKFY